MPGVGMSVGNMGCLSCCMAMLPFFLPRTVKKPKSMELYHRPRKIVKKIMCREEKGRVPCPSLRAGNAAGHRARLSRELNRDLCKKALSFTME